MFCIFVENKNPMTQIIHYNIDQKIASAVALLREQKHSDGYPFMITDEDELSDSQAYMEYSDGHIEVVEFSKNFRHYTSIKNLNQHETKIVRQKYHLENA
jgi:hypothetical protein